MNEPLEKEEASATEQNAAKKPYERPVLLRWGSLRDLTMTIGQVGKFDWGYGRNKYTGRGGLYVVNETKV